jgi:tripartite-type tricarboxylate transporter receptor subunit TctC
MRRWVKLALLLLLIAPLQATAETYPTKPVRLVVPYGVGTPLDVLARAVADNASARLGKPIIVEVKPGAGGAVGATEVLRQPTDGYSLLVISMPIAVGQTIYRNVPFDLRRDFAPIAQIAAFYTVLVVHPSVKARSVADLEHLLKEHPGRLSFASGGPGTPAHIAAEFFKLRTSTDALHVPYNQFPQAIADLLSGQHQFMFAATPPVVPHIAAGRLRALAVTSAERISVLKDVPTMAEAGYPDFVVRDWVGIVTRAGTPEAAVAALNAAIQQALQTEPVKALYAKLGADVVTGSSKAFGQLIDSEVIRWGRVAKAAHLSVE